MAHNPTIALWLECLPDFRLNRCWWCGEKFDEFEHKMEVHHIERRCWAVNIEARDRSCNLFLACSECHHGPIQTASHASQLAKKLYYDAQNFNLHQWLTIRDSELNAPDRVTMYDILQHLNIELVL